MYYAPVGLAAYFAALVGNSGRSFKGLCQAMAVYYPVTIAYFFIAFFAYAYYSGDAGSKKIF